MWDEGAPIETDSAVKLRFRDFKHNFLHCGVVGEVNASAAGSLFQIRRFQAFAPHNAQVLLVGSVVRLIHPQTSRWVSGGVSCGMLLARLTCQVQTARRNFSHLKSPSFFCCCCFCAVQRKVPDLRPHFLSARHRP